MPKASQIFNVSPFMIGLLYADSGAGKSTIGARAPRPCIALTERQGLASIVAANPDADVFLIEGFKDFRAFMEALKRGVQVWIGEGEDRQPAFKFTFRGEAVTCQTIVIDSFSDAQSALVSDLEAVAKDGLTFSEWGTVKKSSTRILDDLRSLPVNVLVLCLAEERHDEGTKSVKVLPDLYGSITRSIGQFFAFVGYLRKRQTDDGISYEIQFEASSRYVAKPAPGFPGVIRSRVAVPGHGTFGSLAMRAFPGVVVPHEDHDSPDLIETVVASAAFGAQTVATDSPAQSGTVVAGGLRKKKIRTPTKPADPAQEPVKEEPKEDTDTDTDTAPEEAPAD